MSVTMGEYMDAIKVVAVPTTEVEHEDGGLTEGSEFWVHTVGMTQYDRPEIEMVKVPGLWLRAAMVRINHWAHYSIENEILPGENLRDGNSTFDPFLVVIGSPDEDDFWAEQGFGCLRITLGAIILDCAVCRKEMN